MTEREAFEKWAQSQGMSVAAYTTQDPERYDDYINDCDYLTYFTEDAWRVWKARAALAQSRTSPSEPELSMSMFASPQDYEVARSVQAVQRAADQDRADAMRYRWLRGERAFRNPEYSTPMTAFWGFHSAPMLVGPTLDAAIDAAMIGVSP